MPSTVRNENETPPTLAKAVDMADGLLHCRVGDRHVYEDGIAG